MHKLITTKLTTLQYKVMVAITMLISADMLLTTIGFMFVGAGEDNPLARDIMFRLGTVNGLLIYYAFSVILICTFLVCLFRYLNKRASEIRQRELTIFYFMLIFSFYTLLFFQHAAVLITKTSLLSWGQFVVSMVAVSIIGCYIHQKRVKLITENTFKHNI